MREELEIGQSGPGEVRDAATALIDAPLDDLVGTGARHAIYSITHPEAPDGTFVTVSSGDRWVYGFTGEPGTIEPADLTPEAMERRIRLSAGEPIARPAHRADRPLLLRRRCSPIASAKAGLSWPATPPTGSPPAEARG